MPLANCVPNRQLPVAGTIDIEPVVRTKPTVKHSPANVVLTAMLLAVKTVLGSIPATNPPCVSIVFTVWLSKMAALIDKTDRNRVKWRDGQTA